MATPTEQLQQLYVAYFSRPADVDGLNYWLNALNNGGTIAQVSAAFAVQPEYTSVYGGKQPSEVIDTVYMNLFGRHAEQGGLDYWGNILQQNPSLISQIVTAIVAGAKNADGTPNADGVAYNDKVTAAGLFTDELKTVGNEAERIAYAKGTADVLAVAKNFIASVHDDATLATATTNLHTTAQQLISVTTVGQTLTLTTGVDNAVGGAGNDTINATWNTALTNPLGGLDVVDGGAGTDTLNVADANTAAGATFSFPAGMTVKNVETLNLISNGSFGTSTAVRLDVSGFTGLTTANITSADSTADFIKAAGTTAVNYTGATGNVDISGGSAVTTTQTSGSVSIVSSKLTSASVSGAGRVIAAGAVTTVAADTGANGVGVIVNDLSSAVSTKTLTAVTLTGLTSAASSVAAAGSNGDATLTGDALTNLTLVNNSGNTVTVVNTTAAHTLGVTVTDTGTSTARTVVTDAAASTIALTASNSAATKTSYVTLTGETAATTVTVAGAGKLNLDLTGAASATSFNGSAATGDLTLTGIATGVASIKTGAGNDTFTTTSTAKFAVDTGAGNDIVTLGANVAAGTTISLGAGNDSLLAGGGVVAASTATATTVIDGGAGVDVVSASLINAANAAQFKNFEGLDLSATANLDVELMTGSTIQTLSLNGHVGATTGVVTNVAAGVGLTVAGDNSAGAATIGVKGAGTGTADAFTITFAGADVAGSAPVAANVKAGLVTLNGIETLNVVSAGGANNWNSVNVGDTGLQTLNITGSKNVDVVFTGTIGTDLGGGEGLKMVDGSAATGKLNIDFTTNTPTIVRDSNVGLTVKGGSSDDIITLATKATVIAGAGDDTIHAAAAGGTFTGGAGKDVFDMSLTGVAIGGATSEAGGVIKTTITDLAIGDSIKLDAVSVAGALGAKVTLDTSVTNLDLALALASNNAVAGTVTWFQYGTNTYIVENSDGTTGIDAATAGPTAGDIVIKLTGLVDLSTSAVAGHVLTIA